MPLSRVGSGRLFPHPADTADAVKPEPIGIGRRVVLIKPGAAPAVAGW